VIPNYFDPEDFPYDIANPPKKEDYFLYIGRMITRKGAHIAVEATGVAGAKLKMAGQGFIEVKDGVYKSREFEVSGKHIEYLGTVGVKERFDLMSKAKAVFVLTQYLGPFEGVQAEANLCGTPVITTDWGCFTENVIDGMNGFRTRTMAEILWAMDNVNTLDRQKIRNFAIKNWSMNRVKWQYQAYFEQLATLWDKGWYNKHYDPSYQRYHKFL
jgi:glycosyltransferase involved in cell wall biosynthesis